MTALFCSAHFLCTIRFLDKMSKIGEQDCSQRSLALKPAKNSLQVSATYLVTAFDFFDFFDFFDCHFFFCFFDFFEFSDSDSDADFFDFFFSDPDEDEEDDLEMRDPIRDSND